MARKKVHGTCCICLQDGELTFEHVPPRAAFNSSRVQVVEGEDAIELPPGEISGGRQQQQGFGAYTLCAKCNNDTGAWYAAAFVHWCTVGGEALQELQGPPKFTVTNFYPLRIAKQIVAMFCSLRGPELVRTYPEIKPFLLDKERSRMPHGLRIFVHHALGTVSRSLGFAMKIDLNTGETTPMSELVPAVRVPAHVWRRSAGTASGRGDHGVRRIPIRRLWPGGHDAPVGADPIAVPW